MSFLEQYWPLIAFVAFLVVSVINTLTPHFDKNSGVKKALLVASEMIAFFTSSDVRDRLMKLPFTSVPPLKE